MDSEWVLPPGQEMMASSPHIVPLLRVKVPTCYICYVHAYLMHRICSRAISDLFPLQNKEIHVFKRVSFLKIFRSCVVTCASNQETFGIDPWRALIFLLIQGHAIELVGYGSDALACTGAWPCPHTSAFCGQINAGLHLDDRACKHSSLLLLTTLDYRHNRDGIIM